MIQSLQRATRILRSVLDARQFLHELVKSYTRH
jgi:hypothetical protein